MLAQVYEICVWYLDDGTIIGDVKDVHAVFQLIEKEGPSLGLYLNVRFGGQTGAVTILPCGG